MTGQLVSLVTMLAAAFLATSGLALAGWGRPDAQVVVAGGIGSDVVAVMPGGPSWRDGVRPGQTVVTLVSGTDPVSWRLETTGDNERYATSYIAQIAVLRDAFPSAMIATSLAAAAWFTIRRLPLAVALASASIIFSVEPMLASGNQALSSAAAVAALIGVAVWLAMWGLADRRHGAAALGLASAVAAVWLVARFLAPAAFEAADLARQGTMGAGVLGMIVLFADWRRWRGRLLGLDSGRTADLVAVAFVLALIVFVALTIEIPLVMLLIAAGSGLLLYPRVRRRLALTIDQVLLGDVRDRASLQAIENERGRIARDLHDEPLQEIAAAIRQLDSRPGTDAEADLLRSAAGHLRRVTTELRPPVLDDLGLRAALAHLAEQATANTWSMTIDAKIEPDDDPIGERPPADVELAIFRIAQEAIDNALRHSGATTVRLRALVGRDEVAVTIEDDGTGIDPKASREALRAGHIGLSTMSQRATIIGAELELGNVSPHGASVRVHWQVHG